MLKDKLEKNGLATLIVIVILALGIFKVYGSESFQIDVTTSVYKVIDGDTFDAFPFGRVRLADVNAPELNEKGGVEAKEALIKLIQGKKVYLDVDDKYVMDRYYRLVYVVYVGVDSEKLLNVNKWLLENNYVYLADFDNEFTPSKWNLYEYYTAEGEKTTILMTTTEFYTVTITEVRTTENENTYYLRIIIVILLIALTITFMLSILWRSR